MSWPSSSSLRERDAPLLAAREDVDLGVARRAARREHRALDDAIELPQVGASIFSWVDASSAIAASIASSSSGSHSLADNSSNLSSSARPLATPARSTHHRLALERRLLRQVADDAPARASPCRRIRSSTPAMILRRVDLPAPFWPTTPILAPGRSTGPRRRAGPLRVGPSSWSGPLK